MTPESFQERPNQKNADPTTQKLQNVGFTEQNGVWKADLKLGPGFNGIEITTIEFRKNGNTWQWRNNSEPASKWLDGERFPTAGVDADVKANRERMNRLADDLGLKAGAKEHDQQLQGVADDFLNKERVAAGSAITPDVEYHVSWVDDSLGYLPFLEHLLEEMEDKDEWTWDGADEAAKEKQLLQSTAQAIRRNMKGLSDALNAAPVKSGKAYERLRSVYLERAKRYTELLGSVNEDEENVELRDAPLAMMQAQEMLSHMTMDEAIDWVKQILSSIDGNDWQSKGLKETYGLLLNTCKAGLRNKIAQEKAGIDGDYGKASAFCGHAMELAKLFTDRGTPIDSDLTDIDFAAEMAKDAMDFEELAMRYVEKTLNQRNPLKEYVASKKNDILGKIATLPEETRNHPQVLDMESTLNANATSVQDVSEQFAVLRTLEAQFSGEKNVDIQQEINGKLAPFLEGAYAQFESFLDGTIGGAANLTEINAAIGEPGMTAMQTEAWQLLADIQGYGYDIGDKTWSYVAMGGKIAGMIAAGIAVGIATGGLGVVAAALSGGAAMTGVNAVVNQQGFDNLDDALKVYGKDFAVNTATMGAARYLSAGRTAWQLSRAGLLKDAGGLTKIMSIAGQKGGARVLGSLDDASTIGTRLVGATGQGVADLGVGTTLETAITGGEFLDNLKHNAMFFGLGYAEFAGTGLRKLRGLPAEDLHGLAQTVNKANIQRVNIQKLTGGVSVEELLSAQDAGTLLRAKGVQDADVGNVLQGLDDLKKTKQEFEAAFAKASQLTDVDAGDNAKQPTAGEEPAQAPDNVKPLETVAKKRTTLDKLLSLKNTKIKVTDSNERITVTFDGEVKGMLDCQRIPNSTVMIVESSSATKGYGPVMYDIAMELATRRGLSLTSDRKRVSDDAFALWKFYHDNRPDVEKVQLEPQDWYMGERADKLLSEMTEDPATWPDKSDPIWVLWTGYKKNSELLPSLHSMDNYEYRDVTRKPITN